MRQARPLLAARRKAAGFSQEALAERLSVDRSTIVRWEHGLTDPQPWHRPKLAVALGLSAAELGELLGEARSHSALDDPTPPASALPPTDAPGIDRLRRGLTEALTSRSVSPSALDDWEQAVLRRGEATRDRPASLLLVDLASDLAEVGVVLAQCRASSALRRMTRVTAQLAGLMCLTLVKLEDRTAFRSWARTARLAAAEAEDPVTSSWVCAQEAYGHYYNRDFGEAIAVARHAQELGRGQPSAGTALAAALEARAHAILGRVNETRVALNRAGADLELLDDRSVGTSAFGYNEAQLMFHEGNAYTHLGDTAAAWRAQERALALCPAGDYMDRAMIRLDQAVCLAHSGDVSEASRYASATLLSLNTVERQGIITLRAQELFRAIPAAERTQPPVRELRELIMSDDPNGAPPDDFPHPRDA